VARSVVASYERPGAIEERKRTAVGKLEEYVAKVIAIERAKIAFWMNRLNERKTPTHLHRNARLFGIATAEGRGGEGASYDSLIAARRSFHHALGNFYAPNPP